MTIPMEKPSVSDFDSPNPAMKHFGPVGNKVGHNGHGMLQGIAVYYMGYHVLDKDGLSHIRMR